MDFSSLCQQSLANGQQTVMLREKRSLSVKKASEQRGDYIKTYTGQIIHKRCRKEYCNPYLINRSIKVKAGTRISPVQSCRLRSWKPVFSYQEHCLFCSQPVVCARKKRAYDDTLVFPVRTLDFKVSVEKVCKERGDEWDDLVRSRIEFAQDLCAVDAVYHQVCSSNFRTGKQIPL